MWSPQHNAPSSEKVSLYIPAYNAARYLARCIDALLQQTYPIDEVLVIDDGSGDTTAEIALALGTKVIRHGRNNGLASARNTGIMASRNEFVAAIDSDCVLEPRWLERCMAHFDDPAVAAVGGRLMEQNHSNVLARWRARYLKHHWGDGLKVNPTFLSGSNTVIRKEVLLSVGPYNEKYKTNHEDVEFSRRLRERNHQLIYEPTATAWHIREDTIRTLLKTYWGWHRHLCEENVSRRMRFYLSQSLRMTAQDIITGDVLFAFLDILSFPVSAYFDIVTARTNAKD